MNLSYIPLNHLLRLTDDTGMLEHAIGSIPRRKEGYSTDDQARALWCCLEWLDYAQGKDSNRLNTLIDTYIAFLLWVQKENGHFHNNIAYDRSKESELPSDDCLGRCLWACAVALVKLKDHERRLAVEHIFKEALKQVPHLQYPRGWAYALAATSLIERHKPQWRLKLLIEELVAKMMHAYDLHSHDDWKWFEPQMSYSNGVLPWGLFWGYEVLKQREILHIAKESMDFLLKLSTSEEGHIRPIGNNGWCSHEYRAVWDQQPIDVMKLMLSSVKAYEVTGITDYAKSAVKCRAWFYGENDGHVTMCHPEEGSCCDGLEKDGPNRNRGAEATLSYLLTEVMYLKMEGGSREQFQAGSNNRAGSNDTERGFSKV